MTVQELIDELQQIENKSASVRIGVEYGRGCWTSASGLDVSSYEDDTTVVIAGEEDEHSE